MQLERRLRFQNLSRLADRPITNLFLDRLSVIVSVCNVPSPLDSGEKPADRPVEGVFERVTREKSSTALGEELSLIHI